MSEERSIRVLDGAIDNDYIWNPGPVVGRFLTRMRDDAELIAVRCPKTSRVFLPPQSWSPYGKTTMDRFLTVSGPATLSEGTIVYRAPWNLPEGLKPPYMYAAIRFAGVDTELLHLVVAPLERLQRLQRGNALQPRWRSERSGSIRDIEYFEPAESGASS